MARRLLIVVGMWAEAPIAPGWQGAGWIVMVLLALAPFAAFFAGRAGSVPAKPALEWTGFTAIGLSSLLIVFVILGDVLHLQAWLGAGLFSAGVVSGALAVLALGSWRARKPAVVRVDVPIHNLPADLEGFRIVQLSDLHVGATLKRDFVERVVASANQLEPDLIALTGDVADGFPTALRDEVAPLAARRPTRQVLRHGESRVLLGCPRLAAGARTARLQPPGERAPRDPPRRWRVSARRRD